MLSIALYLLGRGVGLFHGMGLVIKEPVMTDGMRIIATNRNGTREIQAIGATGRQIRWNGEEVRINLWPRISRWYGSLGGCHPTEVKGMMVIMEEGQQHFCSTKELLQWIELQKVIGEDDDVIYSSDGLVIGWHFERNPHPQQSGPEAVLSVSVWQCYMLGEKPNSLPGARDDVIAVSCAKSECTKAPVGRFSPHKPKTIHGRVYSGKGLDLMDEFGLSYEEIERVIRDGNIQRVGRYVVYSSYEPFNMLLVILDDSEEVVFVSR